MPALRARQPTKRPATVRPDPAQRVLDAAGPIFAQHGYEHATVREICQRARVNIAAVNYYYSDKAGLYRAVFRIAVCNLQDSGRLALPMSGDFASRLTTFIRGFLTMILDPSRPAWHGQLMMHEMMRPTHALSDVVRSLMRPVFFSLASLIAEELSRDVNDPLVLRTTGSIIAQCVWFRHAGEVVKRVHDGTAIEHDTIEDRAAHIASFSLCAVQTLKVNQNIKPSSQEQHSC